MNYKEVVIGEKINRLTIIEDLGVIYLKNNKNKYHYITAVCECGNIKKYNYTSVIQEKTKSCGCLNSENIKSIHKKHGKSDSRIYKIWKGMRKRCLNKNCSNYKNYGGKGIIICEEWNNFQNFYDWSMMNGYKDNLSIDRINNNGSYMPSNCRWVNSTIQNRNTRKNKPFIAINPQRIVFKGQSIAEFAENNNLDRNAVTACLNKRQKSHKNWKFYFE